MRNQFIVSPFTLDQALPGLESLAKPGWILNTPQLSGSDILTRMSEIYHPLAEIVANVMKKGERPVCIAGDCCTAIAELAGIQKAGIYPSLLWFDAHGDFNTWETSPSGFIGGMPLAMIVGRGDQTLVRAIELTPILEGRVTLTDARDLDPGERDALRTSEVLHVPNTEDLRDYPFLQHPLFIHFDVDVICPEDVPAVDYPAAGGISAKDLRTIFQYLAQAVEIVGISVASWDPDSDKGGKSEKICMELLKILVNEPEM